MIEIEVKFSLEKQSPYWDDFESNRSLFDNKPESSNKEICSFAKTCSIVQTIMTLGAKFEKKLYMKDTYYNHPSRDFALTDEALRIRTVKLLKSALPASTLSDNSKEVRNEEEDFSVFLTYKGPKLDKMTKTRDEYETGVASEAELNNILLKLGFRDVMAVEKIREVWTLSGNLLRDLQRKNQLNITDCSTGPKEDNTYAEDTITISLDYVKGLGKYVEIEIEAENDKGIEEKKEVIFALAARLGARESIRKSYLELLLEKNTNAK